MTVKQLRKVLKLFPPDKHVFVSVLIEASRNMRQHQEILGIGGGKTHNDVDVCIVTGFHEALEIKKVKSSDH